jgi:transposase-like protein
LPLFKRRRFPTEIILLCVPWYCKYGISYRDLPEMMEERSVEIDPSTLFRWERRHELSDAQLAADCRSHAQGRPPWRRALAEPPSVINRLMWTPCTGAQWRDLPERYWP